MKNAVRFPKLKNKMLKDKVVEYKQNWAKAEEAIKKGQPICLTDLMIQAENIHLTGQEIAATSDKENQNKNICCECGDSVTLGSGKFVNRIPVLDSYEDRIANGRPYPHGAWICEPCDNRRDT